MNQKEYCRLCSENEKLKLKYSFTEFEVWECKECSFTFVPQKYRKEISYEHYKKDDAVYEAIRKSDHELKLHRHYQRINFFIKYAKGKKLLDVGSGWGHFVWAAKNKGFDACGLELAEYPAKFSMEELKLKIQRINFFDLEEIEKFNVITFWDVLEHIDDIHAFMKKCSSLQEKEDILVLQVPAIDSPVARWKKKEWKMIGIDHVNYFSKKTINRLLEIYGYEMIKFHFNFELKLFLMYYILPMLKRKRGQKVSDANVHIEHKERQQFFNRITKGGKFKKNTMLFLHDMIAKILWILNFGEEMMVIARKK
jgi:2-polyprenyl-3-methyl-5-hydroxy-6-metoxy-1,4-benzoquinol methylase